MNAMVTVNRDRSDNMMAPLSPTPAISGTQASEGLLPPETLRDPSKKDITAANPSWAELSDMPQAT
jgi:hypothetical protein